MKLSQHRSKRKHVRTGLFYGLVALLLLASGTIATSTYAWYNVSPFANVDNLYISYEEATISIGRKDLDTGEVVIEKSGNLVINNSYTMDPVSSMGQSNWLYDGNYDFKAGLPTFYEAYSGIGQESPGISQEASDGYISMEYYFYSSEDLYLFINEGNTALTWTDEDLANAQFRSDYTDEQLISCYQSARVSFYGNMGYTIYKPDIEGFDEDYEVIYSGKLDLDGDGVYDTHQRDEDEYETIFGEVDERLFDEATYSIASYSSHAGGNQNAFKAVSKSGAYAISDAQMEEFDELGYRPHEVAYSAHELSTYDSTHPLLYIPAGKMERLVISLYIEGWDPHCVDAMCGLSYTQKLSFQGILAPEGVYGTRLSNTN